MFEARSQIQSHCISKLDQVSCQLEMGRSIAVIVFSRGVSRENRQAINTFLHNCNVTFPYHVTHLMVFIPKPGLKEPVRYSPMVPRQAAP